MTYPRSIPESPAYYTGSLSDLYERWIRSVLVPSNVVEAFHRQFTEYLRADNPLFLTRKVRDQVRGATVINEYGYQNRGRSIGDLSDAARPAQEGDAVYRYSRLCFKAEVIEALKPDDVFCVVTPGGTFRMTKREFYEEFPRVVSSPSYRIRGLYHFPKPPGRSLKFRVTTSENGTGKDTSKT